MRAKQETPKKIAIHKALLKHTCSSDSDPSLAPGSFSLITESDYSSSLGDMLNAGSQAPSPDTWPQSAWSGAQDPALWPSCWADDDGDANGQNDTLSPSGYSQAQRQPWAFPRLWDSHHGLHSPILSPNPDS